MSNFMEQHYGTAESRADDLFAAMRERGIARIEAEYQGGNDEGGVQSIAAFGPDGEKIEYDGGWQDPLWQRTDELLSTKWGSWAGEFSAWGTLHADAGKRTARTEGSMTVDAADEEPISVGDDDG